MRVVSLGSVLRLPVSPAAPPWWIALLAVQGWTRGCCPHLQGFYDKLGRYHAVDESVSTRTMFQLPARNSQAFFFVNPSITENIHLLLLPAPTKALYIHCGSNGGKGASWQIPLMNTPHSKLDTPVCTLDKKTKKGKGKKSMEQGTEITHYVQKKGEKCITSFGWNIFLTETCLIQYNCAPRARQGIIASHSKCAAERRGRYLSDFVFFLLINKY